MKKDKRLTDIRPPIPDLDARDALVGLSGLSAPLEESIFGTAGILYEFFHSNGYMVRRNEKISQALSDHQGWVYAFYDKQDVPLYIGETKRKFVKRFDEHSTKRWWPYWDRVKVLPCPDRAMRKVLESLVGLHGGYLENKSQPLLGENAFDDVVLCLMQLGNDEDALPTFPNNMVRNQANSLLDLLGPEL